MALTVDEDLGYRKFRRIKLSSDWVWDWGLGFGTKILDWDFGLGFWTGIWDGDWDGKWEWK